jgi:eukaryotic-like serine/threonine-protein kinase
MVLGSPHFISPERAIGAPFGPPSDLFSLGVTLYTAVEGRPPFDRADPFETMRAVVEEPPAPAHRAGALAGVLYGLLEKDPARRWNVTTARSVLRDLLSGALASNAPAHETDPYAVVRPAPYVPPQPQAQPTGQIGGRAMLAPGESLSSAIRRMGAAPAQRTPAHAERTQVPHADAMPPTGGHRPTGRVFTAGAPTTLSGRLRGLPSRVRLAIGAGGALAVLFATAVVAGLTAGAPAPAKPAARPPASLNQPLIPVQQYADPTRGITLNVPKTWRKESAQSYVDFVDPDDRGRRLRINVEAVDRADARQFLVTAENGLKNPRRCPAPYQQVSLRGARLAGRDGALLEYTCGSGDQMRHGIWTATVLNGKSYHFFLTVPDSEFNASKVIFDEMARSFRITAG